MGCRMRRAHVMLEERQYELLREESRRANKSMGQLVRELIDAGVEAMSAGRTRYTIESTSGMFREERVAGRDHDELLYGARR